MEEFKEELAYIGGATVAALVCLVFIGNTVAALIPLQKTETQHAANIKPPKMELTAPDVAPAFEVKANKEAAKTIIDDALAIKTAIDTVELPIIKTELTSLGTYYITGYTSIECGGSTTTASGTTCHKADSIEDSKDNPTTCAIDPALHDFSDVFFIEGFGYYIAEDTGSAVKGKHLDLYFWDSEYSYALSITGKYEVFAVEYVETTYQPGDYDVRDLVAQKVTGWKITGT